MGGSERTDVEALQVTREESRTVLDHQIALQKDIDDKALRTVRLSLVLVALVISIAQLVGPSQLGATDPWTILSVATGILVLFASVFVSLGVYLEADIPFGIGTGHPVEVVEEPYTEREWLEVLLEEYISWTEEAEATNEVHARWLGRAQTAMIVGVAYSLTSTVVLFTPISAVAVFFGSTIICGVALLLYHLLSSEEEMKE